MGQSRRPPGLSHEVGVGARGDRRLVCLPEVAGAAHRVESRSGDTEFGPQGLVLLESTGGEDHSSACLNGSTPTISVDDRADDRSVLDDQFFESGLQVHGGVREFRKSQQESTDQRLAADEVLRQLLPQPFRRQRRTKRITKGTHLVRVHRLGNNVPSTRSSLGLFTEVVGPRQYLKLEVRVLFEVVDQPGATSNVGFLNVGGRPITHH